jgi:hypothetical protein
MSCPSHPSSFNQVMSSERYIFTAIKMGNNSHNYIMVLKTSIFRFFKRRWKMKDTLIYDHAFQYALNFIM